VIAWKAREGESVSAAGAFRMPASGIEAGWRRRCRGSVHESPAPEAGRPSAIPIRVRIPTNGVNRSFCGADVDEGALLTKVYTSVEFARRMRRLLFGFAWVVSVGLFALPAFSQASTTFQASDVLGQTSGSVPSFTTNATDNGTTTNAGGLDYPWGLALDTVNHRLFVSDSNNDRVLEYDLDSQNHLTHYTADHVLGQRDFASSQPNQGGTASSTTMSDPGGLAYDPTNSHLFVADSGNSRVLVFDLSHGITNDTPAANVLGQPDFFSSNQNQGGTVSSTTNEYSPESQLRLNRQPPICS
jgi:hypothetical protein